MKLNPHHIFDNVLEKLRKRNFRGHDVSDIFASPFYLSLLHLKEVPLAGKYLYWPFYMMATKYSHVTNTVLRLKSDYRYPQAHAMIIRALVQRDPSNLELAKQLYDQLLEDRSPGWEHYCWGQPYNWPSSKSVMKKYTPRATVTSQCAMATLELYEVTQDEKYLDVAKSICQFYIEGLNYTIYDDDTLCFSYTSEDKYHIHNASMLAAGVLYRTYHYTRDEKLLDYGRKAATFTAKNQNEDGSWYYWSKPDKIKGVIDNYHTGFVLESYMEIIKYDPYKQFESVFDKGMKYFVDHFISPEGAPKMRPDNVYPLDIQSAAQSIITLGMAAYHDKSYVKLADDVVQWTLNNLFNGKDGFYYRIYDNGREDRNEYIRWGDSWMLRAISVYEHAKNL